jgi:hypothetical protein
MPFDRSKLTLKDLRLICDERGIKKTGRKSEIVDRLEYYDRNDDFRAGPSIPIPESNPMPSWPPMGGFRTLTVSDQCVIPRILPAHIEHYVLHRQVQDRESNHDVSALKKGDRMADESVQALSFFLASTASLGGTTALTATASTSTASSYTASSSTASTSMASTSEASTSAASNNTEAFSSVAAVSSTAASVSDVKGRMRAPVSTRVAVKTRARAPTSTPAVTSGAASTSTAATRSTASTNAPPKFPFFFSGIVAAAMKKHVVYNVKFVLQSTGEIQNSNCECPAGKGCHATCKHIVCVTRVLAHFCATGELKVAGSCTDQLQTFKAPTRAHVGSPRKAEQIGKGVPRISQVCMP